MQKFRDPTLIELIQRELSSAEEIEDDADLAIWHALNCAILCLSRNPAATDRLLMLLLNAEEHSLRNPIDDEADTD